MYIVPFISFVYISMCYAVVPLIMGLVVMVVVCLCLVCVFVRVCVRARACVCACVRTAYWYFVHSTERFWLGLCTKAQFRAYG